MLDVNLCAETSETISQGLLVEVFFFFVVCSLFQHPTWYFSAPCYKNNILQKEYFDGKLAKAKDGVRHS